MVQKDYVHVSVSVSVVVTKGDVHGDLGEYVELVHYVDYV